MKENDVRETSPSLWQPLHEEFRFTLDAAASHGNALCPLYYTESGLYLRPGPTEVSGAINGLTGSWEGERVWCNPPFSELEAWTDKAWQQWDRAELIVMLVPANRTEQPWWQKNVAPFIKRPCFDVRWPAKRQHFLVGGEPCWKRDKAGELILTKKGKRQRSSPKFACSLLIWT